MVEQQPSKRIIRIRPRPTAAEGTPAENNFHEFSVRSQASVGFDQQLVISRLDF